MLDRTLAVAGIILAVLAFPFGYYIRSLGDKRARLYWDSHDESLWDPTVSGSEEFTLTYSGHVIERARKSSILLWSAGPGGVKRAALSEVDPLRVVYPKNVRILAADVVAQVRPASNFKCAITRGAEDESESVRIDLAFMDRGDGARVEILYEDQRAIPPDGSQWFRFRSVDFELKGAIEGNERGFVEAFEARPWSDLIYPSVRLLRAITGVLVVASVVYLVYDLLLSPVAHPYLSIALVAAALVVGGGARVLEARSYDVEKKFKARELTEPPTEIER